MALLWAIKQVIAEIRGGEWNGCSSQVQGRLEQMEQRIDRLLERDRT